MPLYSASSLSYAAEPVTFITVVPPFMQTSESEAMPFFILADTLTLIVPPDTMTASFPRTPCPADELTVTVGVPIKCT